MIFTEENLNKLLSFLPLSFKENIINKYQKRFTKNLTYHIDVLKDFRKDINFKDKIILEVGGGNIPKDYMFFYGAKKYICLDNITEWYTKNGWNYKSDDKKIFSINDSIKAFNKENSFIIDARLEDLPEFFYDKFDIVISIATFEHILNLKESIDIIYELLNNSGNLLSSFAPIYSSMIGHHFWYNNKYNFNTIVDELKFIHLLYSYDEAKEIIKNIFTYDKYGDLYLDLQKSFLYLAYESNVLNKLMYNDYITIFNDTKFKKLDLIPTWILNNISNDILSELENRYGKMRYDVAGFYVRATK